MKRKIVSIALVCVMTVSMTACGKSEKESSQKTVDISASEVISKMVDASQDTKRADSTVELKFSAENDGSKLDLSGKMDVKATEDPTASYVNLELSSKADGDSNDINYELYLMEDNGDYKMYIGTEGQWASTTMSADDLGVDVADLTDSYSQIKEYITDENIDKYFSNVKVTEKKVDKKACYSVKGDVKSDVVDDLLASAESLMGTGIDLSDIGFSVEICADKKTNKPASLTITANSGKDSAIDIKDCSISIKYNSYDVDAITLPEEAENAPEIDSLLDSLY